MKAMLLAIGADAISPRYQKQTSFLDERLAGHAPVEVVPASTINVHRCCLRFEFRGAMHDVCVPIRSNRDAR